MSDDVWAGLGSAWGPSPGARWASPGALAAEIEPATFNTPMLRLIDERLVAVAEGRCRRLIVTTPPQQGKSTRCARWFPLWLLTRDPELPVGISSYEAHIARRWGRAVRNDVVAHGDRLGGLRVSGDTSAADEWTLAGHSGGIYTAGIGGALTGRALGGLVIDDPTKDRAQAESQAYRDAAWEWWTDTALTRLPPSGFVVLIMTRWHEDDLAGRLLANNVEGWEVLNIPALADHNPARGEVDPLGREPDEWLESTRGHSVADWEQTRQAVGARTFAALYQGRPSPAQGELFHRDDLQRYDTARALLSEGGAWRAPGADEVLASWDLTFGASKTSDFVVGQVWGRWGQDVYLLDQTRARMTFTEAVSAIESMTRKWPQATAKLIEKAANGAATLDQLRKTVSGLVPVSPGRDSKVTRALAVTPYFEARQVWVPSDRLAPWASQYVEEMVAFPNARHDDVVDATTQALARLLGRRRGAVSVASPVGLRPAGWRRGPMLGPMVAVWPERRGGPSLRG